jgi:hypothetical protein
LVPQTNYSGEFSTTFRLNIDEFVELFDNISEEIDIKTSSLLLTLIATVHTEAGAQQALPGEGAFVQTCGITITPTYIKWDRPFSLTKKGYKDGIIYEQKGTFGYSVALKPNTLYGNISLNSFIPPALPPVKLDDATTYSKDSIETLEVTFDYEMSSEEALANVEHEVEVYAILTKPGGGQIYFLLIPRSHGEAELSVTFPLDILLFYDIIEAAEG